MSGLLVIVLLAGLALPASKALAGPDAPLYYLKWDAVASGSSVLTSAHYVMRSTTGQPVIGTSKSAHYILHSGYWYKNFYLFMPLTRK
jgi:hypothetical protein